MSEKNQSTLKAFLIFISSLLIILSLSSLGFKFALPFTSWYIYLSIGIFLALLLWIGKRIAKFFWIIGSTILLITSLLIIFNESSTWQQLKMWVILGGISVLMGFISKLIGSQKYYDKIKEEKKRNKQPVYCSACQQYLGTRKNFQTPCPKCGSKDYTFDIKDQPEQQ